MDDDEIVRRLADGEDPWVIDPDYGCTNPLTGYYPYAEVAEELARRPETVDATGYARKHIPGGWGAIHVLAWHSDEHPPPDTLDMHAKIQGEDCQVRYVRLDRAMEALLNYGGEMAASGNPGDLLIATATLQARGHLDKVFGDG